MSTSGGDRSVAFAEESRLVVVVELGEAKVLAAELRGAPEGGPVTMVADWKSPTLGMMPYIPGADWKSPTLGIMPYIPAGTFTMGSPTKESGRGTDEVQHNVTLTKGFLLMEHEVTQGEWQAVMGSNPAYFSSCGATCPVENVSWDDAQIFIAKVSARDKVTYRLPTEAEWEYAARGGGAGLYAGGSNVDAVAWTSSNSGSKTHTVCGKQRNGYDLCDMSGNVWEWTADWYSAYGSESATNPTGASSGSARGARGGSCGGGPSGARVANRLADPLDNRYRSLGFRLARSIP